MITKKEKQVTLYCLNHFLSRPGLQESTEKEVFEWVGPRARELFGMDLAEPERWSSRRYRNDGDAPKRRAARGGTLPCTVKAIRAAIAEGGLVDINAKGYDKVFDIIAGVFKVAPDAGAILRRMVYHEIIPLLSNFDSNVMETYNYFKIRRWQLPRIFGLPPSTAERNLSVDGQLVVRGIIVKDDDGDVALSPTFKRLLECSYPRLTEARIRSLTVGKVAPASLNRDNFRYIADDYDHIAALLGNTLRERRAGVNILLYGIPGTGKTELSKSIAKSAGAKLYMLSEDSANDRGKRLADLSLVQTLLEEDGDAAILFDEAEDIFSGRPFSDSDSKNSKLYFNRMLERNKTPVIWISNDISDMDPAYIRRFKYALEVKKPDQNAKEEIWRKICVRRGVKLPAGKIAEYAKRYDVPPSLIDTAVDSAKLSGSEGAIERTIEALHLAAYGPVPAGRDDSRAGFVVELLNADVDLARLADSLAGKGRLNFSMCLYGEPGTGKSEFARYLAERMGLKVIHKRASDIMDCYVGNTEKNIARAFRDARDARSMLVFDEADSFLRDRRSATRNWEVAHVNEMLTWMESHRFPFVCTTNLMKEIDEASLRRFTFKVKCGYLKPAQVVFAFKHFFGIDIDTPLPHLTHLTPGDFAVVRSKRDFMDVNDRRELVRMLELEQSAKGVRSERMGFAQ